MKRGYRKGAMTLIIAKAIVLLLLAVLPFALVAHLKWESLGPAWASIAALGVECVWLFIFSFAIVAVESAMRKRKERRKRAEAEAG